MYDDNNIIVCSSDSARYDNPRRVTSSNVGDIGDKYLQIQLSWPFEHERLKMTVIDVIHRRCQGVKIKANFNLIQNYDEITDSLQKGLYLERKDIENRIPNFDVFFDIVFTSNDYRQLSGAYNYYEAMIRSHFIGWRTWDIETYYGYRRSYLCYKIRSLTFEVQNMSNQMIGRILNVVLGTEVPHNIDGLIISPDERNKKRKRGAHGDEDKPEYVTEKAPEVITLHSNDRKQKIDFVEFFCSSDFQTNLTYYNTTKYIDFPKRFEPKSRSQNTRLNQLYDTITNNNGSLLKNRLSGFRGELDRECKDHQSFEREHKTKYEKLVEIKQNKSFMNYCLTFIEIYSRIDSRFENDNRIENDKYLTLLRNYNKFSEYFNSLFDLIESSNRTHGFSSPSGERYDEIVRLNTELLVDFKNSVDAISTRLGLGIEDDIKKSFIAIATFEANLISEKLDFSIFHENSVRDFLLQNIELLNYNMESSDQIRSFLADVLNVCLNTDYQMNRIGYGDFFNESTWFNAVIKKFFGKTLQNFAITRGVILSIVNEFCTKYVTIQPSIKMKFLFSYILTNKTYYQLMPQFEFHLKRSFQITEYTVSIFDIPNINIENNLLNFYKNFHKFIQVYAPHYSYFETSVFLHFKLVVLRTIFDNTTTSIDSLFAILREEEEYDVIPQIIYKMKRLSPTFWNILAAQIGENAETNFKDFFANNLMTPEKMLQVYNQLGDLYVIRRETFEKEKRYERYVSYDKFAEEIISKRDNIKPIYFKENEPENNKIINDDLILRLRFFLQFIWDRYIPIYEWYVHNYDYGREIDREGFREGIFGHRISDFRHIVRPKKNSDPVIEELKVQHCARINDHYREMYVPLLVGDVYVGGGFFNTFRHLAENIPYVGTNPVPGTNMSYLKTADSFSIVNSLIQGMYDKYTETPLHQRMDIHVRNGLIDELIYSIFGISQGVPVVIPLRFQVPELPNWDENGLISTANRRDTEFKNLNPELKTLLNPDSERNTWEGALEVPRDENGQSTYAQLEKTLRKQYDIANKAYCTVLFQRYIWFVYTGRNIEDFENPNSSHNYTLDPNVTDDEQRRTIAEISNRLKKYNMGFHHDDTNPMSFEQNMQNLATLFDLIDQKYPEGSDFKNRIFSEVAPVTICSDGRYTALMNFVLRLSEVRNPYIDVQTDKPYTIQTLRGNPRTAEKLFSDALQSCIINYSLWNFLKHIDEINLRSIWFCYYFNKFTFVAELRSDNRLEIFKRDMSQENKDWIDNKMTEILNEEWTGLDALYTDDDIVSLVKYSINPPDLAAQIKFRNFVELFYEKTSIEKVTEIYNKFTQLITEISKSEYLPLTAAIGYQLPQGTKLYTKNSNNNFQERETLSKPTFITNREHGIVRDHTDDTDIYDIKMTRFVHDPRWFNKSSLTGQNEKIRNQYFGRKVRRK